MQIVFIGLIAVFIYVAGSIMSLFRTLGSLQHVIDLGENVLPEDEGDYGSRIALMFILFALSWFGFILRIITYFTLREKYFFTSTLKPYGRNTKAGS